MCAYCYLHFQISREIKRSRLMAQSYVGKRTLSKGIGRVIRRFAYSSFKSYAFGCRGRVSAQLDGLLRAATSFNCAVAIMQDVLVLWGRGAAPARLGRRGGNEAARRPPWQPYDTAPVTRPSRLGQN